jgi:hypothetical protein
MRKESLCPAGTNLDAGRCGEDVRTLSRTPWFTGKGGMAREPPQPDLRERKRTFEIFAKGMAVFAAHILAILDLVFA